MKFASTLATSFAVFFTAVVGARLLTRYILDNGLSFSLRDLIETAMVAGLITVGRMLVGKRA